MSSDDEVKSFFWALVLFIGGFIFPLLWLFSAIAALSWWGSVFGRPAVPSRRRASNYRVTTQAHSGSGSASESVAPEKPEALVAAKSLDQNSKSTGSSSSRFAFAKVLESVGAAASTTTITTPVSTSCAVSRFQSDFKARCLYHFTDIRNLDSIEANGGLLSMREMRHRGIHPIAAGGSIQSQRSDIQNGMDDYVHLCFLDKNPMEWSAKNDGRIDKSVFLEIDVDILSSKGLLLTPGFSNRAGVVPVPIERALEEFDFEILYGSMDWDNSEHRRRRDVAWRYEVLVPKMVGIEKIINWHRIFKN